MLNTILVPVDGSTHANAAVDFASSLSAKFGSKLILVNVITKPGSNRVPEDLRSYAELEKVEVTERDIAQAVATEIVNGAGKRALKQGASKVETLTSVGDPAREIVALAKKRKADMVAMGRRGRGDLKGLLLGSVSHKVSQLTNCPCLTVM